MEDVVKRLIAVLLGVCVLVGLSPAGGVNAASRSVLDITRSDEGRAKAIQYLVHLEKTGASAKLSDVTVLAQDYYGPAGVDRTYLATLDPTALSDVTTSSSAQGVLTSFTGHVTSKDPDPTEDRLSGWLEVGQSCFGRIENSTGWLDHCYKMYRWSTMVSGNYIYVLNHYATFASKGVFHMTRGTIKAVPTAAFTWADWDPAADTTRGCSSITLSVDICRCWT